MSYKFVVLKGKNVVPGRAGTEYVIFDTVEFDCPESELENEQRKYSYRKFYEVDGKNPRKLKEDVFCRRRHVLLGDGSIFAPKNKIFDHEDGTYYAFVPQSAFKF